MISSMLLLPAPRREYLKTGTSVPVATAQGYVLSRIGFGPDTQFNGITDVVTIDPTFIDLDNQLHKQTIGVKHRWDRRTRVYEQLSLLPQNVRSLLIQHQAIMAAGTPIDSSLASVVKDLIEALTAPPFSAPLGWDPLPVLEAHLHLSIPSGPSLPPPDQIGEEEPIVSARSAHEYRLAKIRGESGRLFSHNVRSAYGNKCAFCGAHFGGVKGIRSGVDAAHILAWSKFDLDVVKNGLSLCKNHHWAFDAALLVPVLDGNDFVLQFTTLAEDFDADAMNVLGTHGAPIDRTWLPVDHANWPDPRYLNRLYADLAVEFMP